MPFIKQRDAVILALFQPRALRVYLIITKSNHTPSIIKVDALDIIKVIVAT